MTVRQAILLLFALVIFLIGLAVLASLIPTQHAALGIVAVLVGVALVIDAVI